MPPVDIARQAEGSVENDDPAPILLIGDRPEGLTSLEDVLAELNCTLVWAISAEEAIRQMLATEFAVVLFNELGKDGLRGGAELDAVKLILSRPRPAPIILLTRGYGTSFPVDDAYAVGVADVVAKPVSPAILRAKVAVFVELFNRARPVRRPTPKQSTGGEGREHQDLWRTTLASIGDAVIATDVNGRVTFLNPVAESLTGWPPAEARGQSLTDVFRIVNESTRVPVDNPALRALETGAIVGLANHTVLIARGGAECPIDDSAAPIRDASGTVSGAVLVFRDITERKHAEQARARLAAIVESSNDAIVGKTLDGVIQTWNGGAERVFGYTAEEAVGQSIRMLLPPERQHEEDDILARVSRGERIEHFETVRVRKDGQRIDISVSVAPIRDSHGDIVGASKTARDITATKQVERALTESRRRSASALQAGEVGTYYWDMATDRVSGDRNFAAIFGVLPDDHSSAPVGDFLAAIHPEDRARVGEEIHRTLATDAPFRSEYRVPGGHGERWLLARGAVERDDAGVPVGWAGVIVDISNRKAAEAALAQTRAESDRRKRLYETILSNTPDLAYVWGLDHRFTYANEILLRMWGKTWDEAIGKNCLELGYEPWHAAMHDREIDEVVATRRPLRGEVPFAGTFGRRIYDYLLVPVIGADGEVEAVAGTTRDVTDRKALEDRLREGEERFRSLFESMDEGYCVIEPVFDDRGHPTDYRYVLVNPAFEAHTGLRDAVGRTARQFMPEHESHWIEEYARVAVTGEPLRKIDRAEQLDRWFDVSAFRVGDPAARQVGVLFTDITARKRAEALLREKDERLNLLLGAASDYAVVIMDRDGLVLDWLGGAEAITGYPASDVIGKPADVFFTPEDRAAGVPAREMITTANTGRAEDKRWHQKRNGEQFFADGVMVALREGGKLRGFGKVFRDATSRKRADDAIRFMATATASLAELVDYQSTLGRIANLATGVFADWCVVDILDEQGTRRRLTVTSKESEDVTAMRATDAAYHPTEVTAGVVPHVLRTGQPEVVPDLLELNPETAPQGRERIAKLRGMGVRSYLSVPLLSRGRVLGGMTFLATSPRRRFGIEELRVAQSLAERVTVAIENAQLYRTLQEQDRRKDEFLATLAHELRNPLAPVRNGVQILRTAVPDEPRLSRTLGMMERQLGQMVHLVDDLMDVSRVSSGKVVLRREQIPLRVIVDAAVETSRQLIESAEHEFAAQLPDEPVLLDVDQTRLVQVLANLLNNAAKYTPPGGRIVLSAETTGEEAVIRVADTGVGIPADMLPKVFDMFTQVGTSLERSQGGLGIGLTLVRRLVEMHGGSASVESAGVDRGSTFTIRLPLTEAAAAEQRPSAGSPDRPTGNSALDILVVDDNQDSAESMSLLLQMRRHHVLTAHDGPEALRLLATYRPHLILLDLGLPGMSGYDVARRIRQSTELQGVRLVALTGWGQEEDRRRTKEAGFDHHLVKPADIAELDHILATVARPQ